jgi:hypothetical protein
MRKFSWTYIMSLVLALCMVFIISSPSFAKMSTDQNRDLVILTNPDFVDVQAPSDFSWTFTTIGLNENTPSGNARLYISTDMAKWTLNVVDAMDIFETEKPTGSEGKMVEATGSAWVTSSPKILTNPLVIDATYGGGNSVTLSGSNQALWLSADNYTGYKDLSFKQTTTVSDTVLTNGDVYRIVLTFTISPG